MTRVEAKAMATKQIKKPVNKLEQKAIKQAAKQAKQQLQAAYKQAQKQLKVSIAEGKQFVKTWQKIALKDGSVVTLPTLTPTLPSLSQPDIYPTTIPGPTVAPSNGAVVQGPPTDAGSFDPWGAAQNPPSQQYYPYYYQPPSTQYPEHTDIDEPAFEDAYAYDQQLDPAVRYEDVWLPVLALEDMMYPSNDAVPILDPSFVPDWLLADTGLEEQGVAFDNGSEWDALNPFSAFAANEANFEPVRVIALSEHPIQRLNRLPILTQYHGRQRPGGMVELLPDWVSGFGWVSEVIGAAGQIGAAAATSALAPKVKSNKKADAAALALQQQIAAQNAAILAAQQKTNYTPLIIGGGALLLIGAFLLTRKK